MQRAESGRSGKRERSRGPVQVWCPGDWLAAHISLNIRAASSACGASCPALIYLETNDVRAKFVSEQPNNFNKVFFCFKPIIPTYSYSIQSYTLKDYITHMHYTRSNQYQDVFCISDHCWPKGSKHIWLNNNNSSSMQLIQLGSKIRSAVVCLSDKAFSMI